MQAYDAMVGFPEKLYSSLSALYDCTKKTNSNMLEK